MRDDEFGVLVLSQVQICDVYFDVAGPIAIMKMVQFKKVFATDGAYL